MAHETTSGVEAVLKKPREEGFVFGQGDHAVANVTGRQHTIFAAQTPGAAAVVGDGDDRGEVGDGTLRSGQLIATAHDVFFQATEQRGKAGAAAEGNDAESG